MEIKVPLNLNNSAKTYPELRNLLKQLELSIHHAQKAVETAEKEGMEISEDSFICWEYPALKYQLEVDQKDTDDMQRSTFMDNYFDELQEPELRISLD